MSSTSVHLLGMRITGEQTHTRQLSAPLQKQSLLCSCCGVVMLLRAMFIRYEHLSGVIHAWALKTGGMS